jgi:hypothetical protein
MDAVECWVCFDSALTRTSVQRLDPTGSQEGSHLANFGQYEGYSQGPNHEASRSSHMCVHNKMFIHVNLNLSYVALLSNRCNLSSGPVVRNKKKPSSWSCQMQQFCNFLMCCLSDETLRVSMLERKWGGLPNVDGQHCRPLTRKLKLLHLVKMTLQVCKATAARSHCAGLTWTTDILELHGLN